MDVRIRFTNYKLFTKLTLITLLFCLGINSANAAFILTNGTSFTVGSSATFTVSGAPSGTTTVKYFISGNLFGSSTTGTTYSVTVTPTGAGTFPIYATAYNSSGTSLGNTATVNTNFYPPAPSATGSANCGPGTTATLTASGGNPSGGNYNWYAASSGGTALQSGTSTTYTTPAISASTTYYVSYTSGGLESTSRTAVTATIGSQPVFSVVPTSPASGLSLSYPFTGNANDVSGNSNTGIPQNTPTLTTDRFNAANSAYSFNGSSQYIATTKATSTSPVTGPLNYSISVWFKTSTAGGKLVGFGSSQTGSSGNYDRHIYMTSAGQLYFGIYPSTINTTNTINSVSGVNYADGKWHHVVATESTTSGATLFVDGAIVAADPTMILSQAYDGYWRVAYDNLSGWPNSPSDYYFTGSLDDIAVYTSALTASQIYTIYGAGSPPTCIGSPLLLQANSVSGVTYAWTGPNSYTSTSQNPTVSSSATAAMAGTYTCTITNTTTGCSSAISVTAVVNALPASSFTATSTVATNVNATITNTATNAATSTYAWNFNGGTIVSGSGAGPYTITWNTPGSKTVTQTVTNASGCTAVSTQTVTVTAGTYSTYAYTMPITLKTSSLGISSDLTNFPFLVTITDPSLVATSGACNNKVQFPNGPNYDFAFVDGNTGTEDNYQVESYNQATGTLLVWVQLPTLSHTTNNTLSFYYGSASAPSSHTTSWYQATWASDYKAVYHFNEASYTGTAVDATSNGNTGTMTGMSAASQVTGVFDKAYTFAGSQKITANAVSVTGTFTLSAWINLSTLNTDQKIMTNQGSGGGGSGGYKLGVYNNNLPETESGLAGDRGSSPFPTALTSSQWYYIQGVYSGSTLTTYVNGIQYEVYSTTTNPTSTTNYFIGVGEGGTSFYFNGLIEEPRVSNVVKTTDWLYAEYQNQLNPASLTSSGTVTGFFSNAAAIKGGITYNTTDGTNYTYTFNSATTSATPPTDGTASYNISGTATLSAGNSIYGLTVNSSSNQINLNGQTLNVGCNIVNNGTINNTSSTAATIVYNGSAATQTYTGTSTSVATVDNLTVNNSASGIVTITGGGLNITNTLTLTKGSITVNNAGSGALTLKSTATQTATVAAITQGSITGTVNVERYLTGGTGYRGYRLMSSPVYAATVSPNNVYSLNYVSNSAYITGSTGTSGGFDKTGNPTLYLYREDQVPNNTTFISGNFSGISALNNSPAYNYFVNGGSTTYNLPVGNGYMFFFRGNRASATVTAETTTTYVPVTATLVTAGTLNQGQFTVHNWYTPSVATIGYTGTGTGATTNANVRGFNLVGNPYASSISWETFNTTSTTTGIYGVNIGTTIYEFNPLTKNYDTYQKGGSHTNSGTAIIASGQGFFVLASAASPQLIFNESAKTATENTGATLFMSKQRSLANGQNPPHMRLQLALDSVNTDDTYIEFESTYSTAFVENEDAAYRAGQGVVNIASVSTNNVALAINKTPLPGPVTDTIPIKVYAAAQGLYALNLTEFEGIPQLYEVWLMDRYKKDSLDLRANNKYLFNIYANDTTSYGAKRFYLILRQNPALGVHLLSFTAAKVTLGAQTAWKVENEADYTTYSVERSIDNGVTYALLDTLQSTGLGTYNFLDTSPINGVNLYRLKQVDLNGAITYSAVIAVSYGNAGNSLSKNNISIYPNPAVGTLNVAITQGLNTTGSSTAAAVTPSYSIIIVNALGAVVQTGTATQTNWTTDVSRLITGSYIIQVFDNNSKIVVGKSTFIKL